MSFTNNKLSLNTMMIQQILSLTESSILLFLAIVHFNWALGGKWAFDKALPTKENGELVLRPKRIDCAIVGFGLLIFACYYLMKIDMFNLELPQFFKDYFGLFISAIFILRALGEFKYVGFFKKIRNTEFGALDSKFYSPLCLILGTIGIVIHFI